MSENMSEHINIKWIGEERQVPSYGVFVSGEIYPVDSETASSLIKQGLAKEHKPKPAAKADKKKGA